MGFGEVQAVHEGLKRGIGSQGEWGWGYNGEDTDMT